MVAAVIADWRSFSSYRPQSLKTLRPTPTITSITVSDITMTSATVTVDLADTNDGTTVYLKYDSATIRLPTNPKAPAYNVGNGKQR